MDILWTRKCNNCGVNIIHKSKLGYESAERSNKHCKRCRYKHLTKTTEEFILSAERVHNNRYDYSRVKYISSHRKVEIICKTHGIFLTTPHNHIHGRGCPKCCLYMSKGERATMKWLDDNKIIYNHQYKFDDCKNPSTGYLLKFDFYIPPPKNILIEFDGEQHYRIGAKVRNHVLTEIEVKNIQMRDYIKTQYAINKNIPLIRIPYKDINRINETLQKEIYG